MPRGAGHASRDMINVSARPPDMSPLPRLDRVRTAIDTITERLGKRLALGLLAACVVLLLFAALAGEVREGETQHFDESIRFAVHRLASPPVTAIVIVATQLGSPAILLPGTLAAAYVFVRQKRVRGAILLLVTMVGATLLQSLLKLLFQRTRPVPFFGLPTPTSYSFPSGHALASFCFYGALAALVAGRIRARWLRWTIRGVAGLVIACVGFTRIYLGVHYASDVIAGYAAAFVWVLTVVSADRVFRPADKPGPRPPEAEPPPGGPS
jgi:membrane-associated phospholipid phosphatase